MMKVKKKYIFTILVILMIISIFSGYKIYAETQLADEKLSTGESSDGTYVRLKDLYEKYYILCSYHGGEFSHLPSENNVTLVTEKGSSEEGYLTRADIGKKLFLTHVEGERFNTPFKKGTYKNETYAYYKKVEEKIATPMEAYILAEMKENNLSNAGDDNYTYVQHAWWTTPAGSKGQKTVQPNELSKIASAFEEYIKKVAEKESNGSIKYTEQVYTLTTGETGTVEAPEIKYKATINEDSNQDGTINEYDKATASFDSTTGKYRVGPFSINYLDDCYKMQDGKQITFSGIENITLVGNLGVIPKDKWSFYWLKGQRDINAKTDMPTANEVFYIDIDYIEGLTEILDIKVKFKYMNAGGKYEDLEGTYYKATWKAKSKANWCNGASIRNKCVHLKNRRHIESWDYWVELTNLHKYTGQRLASGLIGVRWYEEVEISLGNLDIEHSGKLKIIKKVEGEQTLISNKDFFDFEIYINGNFYDRVSVRANEAYVTTFEWEGSEVPTYEVKELTETMPEGYEFVRMENATGTLIEDNTVEVVCTNKSTKHTGKLRIIKKIDGTALSDKDIFDFEVYINGNFYDRVSVKANSEYVMKIDWTGEKVPTYEVREITTTMPSGYTFVEMQNATGTFIENNTVSVVCINKPVGTPTPTPTATPTPTSTPTPTPTPKQKRASLVISKKAIGAIRDDKGNKKEYPTFTFELTIKEEGKDAVTRTITVKAGETYKTEEFVWYNEAPIYSIKEINVPEGCTVAIHNGSGTLIEGKEVWVNCLNSFTEKLVELTMTMGGKVWKEDIPDYKDADSYANGLYDEGEEGLANIEVYIWKVIGDKRELATVRDVDNESILSQPLYTDIDGNWTAPRMTVPYEEDGGNGYYDIEFKYDGQTYEPTTALVTAGGDAKNKINGNAETYMKASTSERDKYKNDSMALEEESQRDEFNKKFEEIYGKQSMDDDGNTIGAATGVESLEYTSTDYVSAGSDNTRKISKLTTLDNQGYVLDKFKMSSKVSTAGLKYPFDDKLHMEEYDKTIEGLTETTKYIATDYYLQHINLGLVQREEADVSLTKDLYSAKVVVNNKLLTYNYNTAVNFEEEPWVEALEQQIKVAEQDISYELKLYRSDYFYRTAIYDSNTMGYSEDVINQIKSVTAGTEMEVYLTYKVSMHNESQTLLANINKVIDYYDADLTLVSDDIVTKIDVLEDSKLVRKDITVAEKTYYDVLASAEQDPTPYSSEGATGRADWKEEAKGIKGSDGVTYNKISTESLRDYSLASGEKIDLYITFKVNKDAVTEGIDNSIVLGEKHNVAEIANYSTYYEDGRVAGRIDKDSAPDNVNIENHNEKAWYEDDTDSAPLVKLDLYDEVRYINGMVWEDEETNTIAYSQKIGDGEYQENENKIEGMTVKLVEKITVDKTDYDFIWPEEFMYNGIDLMEIMKLKSQILTDENGEYKFEGVPAGNYAVRFVYGSTSNSEIVDDYMLAVEGDKTLENGYNGQDYKSTIYQAGFDNTSDEGYLNNVWHDFTNGELKDKRVSDARDDELRRLEVVAYSRTINNKNAEVLESADSKEANHDELAKYTSMVANTAKMDIEIEYKQLLEESGIEVTVDENGTLMVNGDQMKGSNYKYDIPNIDFGLEKRSITVLELNNQIDEIIITTSDNKNIVDAIYKHEYSIGEDGKVSVETTVDEENSVGFEHIQSVNSNEKLQGFRYVNVDEKIMQGLTITIKYGITVFDTGEVDRTGKLSTFNTGEEILKEVKDKKSAYANNEELKYGEYLGTIYYTGKGDSDAVVATNVEQIIDYVDNNSVFSETKNSFIQDNSWRTISIEELLLGDSQKDILTETNNDYGINNKGSMLEAENYRLISSDGTNKPLTSEDVEELRQKIANNENIGDVTILDSEERMYVTEQRNNLAVSISDSTYNPSISTKLVPYNAYKEGVSVDGTGKKIDYKGKITITASRFLSPETDTDDVDFNNLAEIIQFSNTVGRRDIDAKVGNANPMNGEYIAAQGGSLEGENGEIVTIEAEHDAGATEIITLSAPTGLSEEKTIKSELLIIGILSGVILVGGIFIIKKKVLNK